MRPDMIPDEPLPLDLAAIALALVGLVSLAVLVVLLASRGLLG